MTKDRTVRHHPELDLRSSLRAQAGQQLADLDPRSTVGFPGKGKAQAPALTAALAPELSDWQERLYAESRDDDMPSRALLVILQGMDTSGKGGIIRHVFGLVDPQGLALHAFKQPTKEELSHNFLWRIKRALPDRGMIGIFDRSQYEDVLIGRVDQLVSPEVWQQRYLQINRFEADLVAHGVTVMKCFLHISPDEQKKRLLERLDNPEKHWKFSASDVPVRRKWPQYQEAYQDAINQCNTDAAPWYVIPSDRKWYRNWAVARLLLEHLREMRPAWPPAEFDVAAMRLAVEESLPSGA
ncbi:MAG: polyphosphate kinase 2 family protein [Propionibacteriaceae bacterium]|nr:polyphosphate kinase 2 family protein [Propionibacteriaceae bacterium]